MRTRKKLEHTHKYEKKMLGSHMVFKCAIPGCHHYIRKELAEGRFSVCWRCEETFVLDKVALGLRRPHCIPCTKFKKKHTEKVDKVKSIDRLAELFSSQDLLSKVAGE